jgi:hypothetical protein
MKFFWFNDVIIRPYLKAKRNSDLIDEHFFGNSQYKMLHQLNWCFSSTPFGMQHDITNHVTHPFNIKTRTSYEFRSESRSFTELCIDAANKISKITNNPIALLWSGGIDSTAALVALMQVIPLKQITVVCDHHSIEEYPTFYQDKIAPNLPVISIPEWHQNYQNYFTVTGDGGDTVWGAVDSLFWARDQHRIRHNWKDCIDRPEVDIDFVEEFCSWSQVDIKTWIDLRTWFYLCCKWQDKCMRLYALHNDLTDQNAAAFYDLDSSFQCWTMNNLDKIIGSSWEEYKVPAKTFINNFHKDDSYFKYKSKVESPLRKTMTSAATYKNICPFAILEDYSSVVLPRWPFIDYAEIEDSNDKFSLFLPEMITR